MSGMNTKRILVGGLYAGLVINLSEFVLNGVLLMDDFEAMMEQYALQEAGWAMTGYILGAFLIGFTIAWLYAAIRPRFGPGWKTGVMAGAAIWVASYVVPSIWMGAMGISFGAGLTTLSLVWGFAEVAVAGMAAGWSYRE